MDIMIQFSAMGRIAWVNSLSEEDQAKFEQKRREFLDPATKDAKIEEHRPLFTAADANNDGRLDFQEMKAFIRANYEHTVAQGLPAQK